SFRIGHAEVSIHALLQRFALLVAYHDDRAAIEAGKAADDRMIVGEGAISVQFNKAIAQAADVVQSRGPLQMTCDLCTLPSRQARIDLGLQLMESRPELVEIFLTPAARMRGGGKLFELILELRDRLFKVQIFAHETPIAAIRRLCRPELRHPRPAGRWVGHAGRDPPRSPIRNGLKS